MENRRIAAMSSIVVCLLLTTWTPSLSAQTTIAGRTPVQFAVSDTGGATYRVPIQVPPGVGGIEPKLEMVYNSHAGNGLLGLGWGLGGLSAISRCPSSVGTDALRGAVKLKSSDKFCLDGQRLVLVAGATYGVANSEYRTERESFARVTANGGDNTAGTGYTGPMSFTVKTKAGLTLEFGGTEDSRLQATGGNAILHWALNRITDTKGNYLSVTYLEDTANGSHRPLQVSYAGNSAAGKLPGMSVQFVYGTRSDSAAYFVGGSAIRNLYRLTNVKTYVGAAMVKDYRLSYLANPPGPNSTLASIRECVSDGSCLAPITVEYASAENALSNGTLASGGIDWGATGLGVWKDVNGDGKADFCRWASGAQRCNYSVGTGFSESMHVVLPAGTQGTGELAPDLNGDGLADFCERVVVTPSTPNGADEPYALLNCVALNGAGAILLTFPSTGSPLVVAGQGWADVDGDGRDDWCALVRSYVGVEGYEAWTPTCIKSTGAGWGGQMTFAGGGIDSSIKWVDADGDGRADYCRVYAGVPTCSLSDGGASVGATISGTPVSMAFTEGRDWVDFNGDGKIDFCYVLSTSQLHCMMGTGTGFVSGPIANGIGLGNVGSRVWVDVDGDGRADFCTESSIGQASCTLSTGHGFGATYLSTVIVPSGAPARWVDVNGDGFLDYCRRIGTSMSCLTSLFMDGRAQRFVEGSGASVAITYQSIASVSPSAVYVKDTSAVYPMRNRQNAAKVVAAVAASDGTGGFLVTNYTYGGLKDEVATGRGMLGFRWVSGRNAATQIENFAEYSQGWPYVGMLVKEETRLAGAGNGSLLRRTSVTPACAIPLTAATCVVAPGNRYFTYPMTRVVESWDLNGAALPAVTTTFTHSIDPPDTELRGEPTVVLVTHSLGSETSTRTTTNSYWSPSDTGGVAGLLKRVQIASTVPDSGPASNVGWTPGLTLTLTPGSVISTSASPGVKSAVITPIVSGGFPTYSYSWQRIGAGFLTMTTNAQGILTVSGTFAANQTAIETFRATVVDQSGAQSTADVVVSIVVGTPPAVSLTASPATQTKHRLSSGSAVVVNATATGSGGIAPYSFAWTRISGSRTVIANATSATATFTAAVNLGENFTETMRVTMTDSIGTSAIKDVAVQYTAPATVSGTVSNTPATTSVTCNSGLLAVSSTVTPSGGYPPYVNSWLVTMGTLPWRGFRSVTPSGAAAVLGFNQDQAPQGSGQEYWSAIHPYSYQVRITDSVGNVATVNSGFSVNRTCAPPPSEPGGNN